MIHKYINFEFYEKTYVLIYKDKQVLLFFILFYWNNSLFLEDDASEVMILNK